jgi:hypothetical protein
VFSKQLRDTLAYTAGKNKMTWFRPSVGETCPCTSVQHGATETVSTYLNTFVCSAVVGRVCRCKISAKYGCSVTIALLYSSASRVVFSLFCSLVNPYVLPYYLKRVTYNSLVKLAGYRLKGRSSMPWQFCHITNHVGATLAVFQPDSSPTQTSQD